jgi:HNH endonuclease
LKSLLCGLSTPSISKASKGKPQMIYQPVPEKRCPKCDEVLPWTEFGVMRNKRNRPASWCKACYRSESRRRYVPHPSKRTFNERFWSKVDKSAGPDGCWIWTASTVNGYGRLDHILAHRYSYEQNIRPVPEGLEVLHSCDNPGCVNPRHLWVGTHQDNMTDRNMKGRSSAPVGEQHGSHKLTEEEVRAIRRIAESGICTQQYLANMFGVSDQTIHRIVHRKNWKHLD